MRIERVLLTKSYTGYYFDDQKAIKHNAKQDGFLYPGHPELPGFKGIRIPGEAISIQLVLEDGGIAQGDCASVQYSGAGGRDPLFLADEFIPLIEREIVGKLKGATITTFRDMAKTFDSLKIDGQRMHTAIRYGLTQALLHAVALKDRRTMAEVIRDEYDLANPITRIPIFAQTGDDRYMNVDKMILKEVDVLPHALINNIADKLGYHGELLLSYISWLRDRIIAHRSRADYEPILHVDVYGTIGIIFDGDIDRIVSYIAELAKAAAPFRLRLEGPIDAGDRKSTMEAIRMITRRIDLARIPVEIVADEWCNNFDDIRYFADHRAGHVIQIKTPDLGGINNICEAIIYCKSRNIGAYSGGTCNETDISARVTTQIAMACQADVCLAKPGMDVDSGYMVVKNEMER
ncbi:MAG: methylaspartate ammonia-lyase, partial [Acholeplasmataceae bacterium]